MWVTKDNDTKYVSDVEVIKFICTEFWKYNFNKAIDNLSTNHKGTFILMDEQFAMFGRLSVPDNDDPAF
jgi:hypothetical protein